MSEILVNGRSRPHQSGLTLADVVRSLTASTQGYAVALNDSVVPRSDWPQREVAPGDRIEVVTAVQGG